MTIKRIHTSRKSAALALTMRGWNRAPSIFGDWIFTHPEAAFKNILVQLRNSKWEIQYWGS